MKNFSFSFFLPVLALAVAVSCSKESFAEKPLEIVPVQDYTVSLEDALKNLEDFMVEQGVEPFTKGSFSDYVDNSFVVRTHNQTKGMDSSSDLMYGVNFKDDAGYALLSADSRVQESVLAVIERGHISESDFQFFDENLVPTENDDLSVEEYGEMVESGVLAQRKGTDINRLCYDYMLEKVDVFDGEYVGGSSSTPVTYEWRLKKQVPAMLKTLWTQDGVFNRYCPVVGLIWKKKAPAGCVCIAVSQIIAFHEYPAPLVCQDMPIDYAAIKRRYSIYDRWNQGGSEYVNDMLAKFCYVIGGFCHTAYHSIFGFEFGFAWPWDAKDCLEKFYYKNVSLNLGYDENRVIASLDNGCPVFMSAIAGLFGGHAWVIDGYTKREYVSNTGHVKDTQTLIHCNWGWNGDCNGYYTSGIFNTRKATSYDGYGNYMNKNYWYAFNTITYDNPNL